VKVEIDWGRQKKRKQPRKETNWTAKQRPISPFLRKLLTPTTPEKVCQNERREQEPIAE
jgi:hypothetical protein